MKLSDIISALEERKVIQRQTLTGIWVDILHPETMTLAHLSRLACENKLRIKKEPLKIEASGYKIHHPVNGYVFKIFKGGGK